MEACSYADCQQNSSKLNNAEHMYNICRLTVSKLQMLYICSALFSFVSSLAWTLVLHLQSVPERVRLLVMLLLLYHDRPHENISNPASEQH